MFVMVASESASFMTLPLPVLPEEPLYALPPAVCSSNARLNAASPPIASPLVEALPSPPTSKGAASAKDKSRQVLRLLDPAALAMSPPSLTTAPPLALPEPPV